MLMLGQILLTALFAASMLAVGWLAWRAVQRQDEPTGPGKPSATDEERVKRHS